MADRTQQRRWSATRIIVLAVAIGAVAAAAITALTSADELQLNG